MACAVAKQVMFVILHSTNTISLTAVSSNNRLQGSYSDGKAVWCYFPLTDGFHLPPKLKYFLFSCPEYENIEHICNAKTQLLKSLFPVFRL